jgi:hypothetical protein
MTLHLELLLDALVISTLDGHIWKYVPHSECQKGHPWLLFQFLFSWERDREINFILRIKKQETRLILHKHDDDDDDDDDDVNSNTSLNKFLISAYETRTYWSDFLTGSFHLPQGSALKKAGNIGTLSYHTQILTVFFIKEIIQGNSLN